LPFLFRDSAECKRVYFCTRCSLGWRVTLSGTALDVSGAKVQRKIGIAKHIL